MISLKRLVWGGVCLGLAAGTALAQTTTQAFRQTGNLVGASASVSGPNYTANVTISPAVVPGNSEEGYVVNWSTTIYGGPVPPAVTCPLPTDPPPLPPDLIATTVSGFVPVSAIQKLPSGGLSVDLDIGKVKITYFGSVQCVSKVCNPIAPPSAFPLKGSFTPVTSGPGTFSASSSGSRSSVTTDPVCQFVYSFNGNQSDMSAKFAGQIGAITVPTMAVGGNGQLHIQKGQSTTSSTCVPPPPPAL